MDLFERQWQTYRSVVDHDWMEHRDMSAACSDALRTWMLAGFVVTFVSGALLFWPSAGDLYVNPLFRLKMLFMLAAGANALAFESGLGRRVATWADPLRAPTAARLAGWASLTCWALVILFGRWIAYGPGAHT